MPLFYRQHATLFILLLNGAVEPKSEQSNTISYKKKVLLHQEKDVAQG
jgi:hypothetical protein